MLASHGPVTPNIDRWSLSHNSPFNYELVFEFIMEEELKPWNNPLPPVGPIVVIFCLGFVRAHEHFCTWMQQERIKCTPKAAQFTFLTFAVGAALSAPQYPTTPAYPHFPGPVALRFSSRPIPISLAGLSTRFLRCCHNTHTKRQTDKRNKK